MSSEPYKINLHREMDGDGWSWVVYAPTTVAGSYSLRTSGWSRWRWLAQAKARHAARRHARSRGTPRRVQSEYRPPTPGQTVGMFLTAASLGTLGALVLLAW